LWFGLIALPLAGLLAIVDGRAGLAVLVVAVAVGALGGAALGDAGDSGEWTTVWERAR
jgi:hypothetical protein